MLNAHLANDVRRMTPGDTVARVSRIMARRYSATSDDSDRTAFNAHIGRLRVHTGFDLVVQTLAPQVIGDYVLRCYCVTRIS